MSTPLPITSRLIAVVALTAFSALSGCAYVAPEPMHVEGYGMPKVVEQPTGKAGGLFVDQAAWSLTSDNHAFRPGDTLTVLLEESTQASKKAGTSFGKKSSVDIKPGLLATAKLPVDSSIDANRTFDGSGTSEQQNALQGEITVVVHQVLPNGLLEVKGEKVLALNQGEEVVRLSGYVRTSDIDTNNRVSSQRIANSHIQYVGRGALADVNQAGWLTRVLNSALAPF
jgi:flagellar L-ring protein precursor FlgH